MNYLVSVDPGINKCGLVLSDIDKFVVLKGIVIKSEDVIPLISQWKQKYPFKEIILGNGTSCNYWEKLLSELANIILVEERGTTLRARERYWQLWPKSNWQRILPKGICLPPSDLDAVAALLLLEDYLGINLAWLGPPDFKNVL